MGTCNICLYKEVDKKYTGYNLKTAESLDCALIGVCAVFRSNKVMLKRQAVCHLIQTNYHLSVQGAFFFIRYSVRRKV